MVQTILNEQKVSVSALKIVQHVCASLKVQEAVGQMIAGATTQQGTLDVMASVIEEAVIDANPQLKAEVILVMNKVIGDRRLIESFKEAYIPKVLRIWKWK